MIPLDFNVAMRTGQDLEAVPPSHIQKQIPVHGGAPCGKTEKRYVKPSQPATYSMSWSCFMWLPGLTSVSEADQGHEQDAEPGPNANSEISDSSIPVLLVVAGEVYINDVCRKA